MSEEEATNNVEEQFQKFLADNKIDTSALAGTKEGSRLLSKAKDQRTVAILKAVSYFHHPSSQLPKTSNFAVK